MRLIFLLFLCSSALTAQEIVYSADSLTTRAAIPQGAVKVLKGMSSGPNGRLQAAIFSIIRYPKSALIGGAGGKILVYGVVERSGEFQIDSAALFQPQAAIVLEDTTAQLVNEDVYLGSVNGINFVKKKVKVEDFPKKWSTAQRDMVRESIRIGKLLPTFKPATLDGRIVASRFELPVVFRNLGAF